MWDKTHRRTRTDGFKRGKRHDTRHENKYGIFVKQGLFDNFYPTARKGRKNTTLFRLGITDFRAVFF